MQTFVGNLKVKNLLKRVQLYKMFRFRRPSLSMYKASVLQRFRMVELKKVTDEWEEKVQILSGIMGEMQDEKEKNIIYGYVKCYQQCVKDIKKL